MGQFVVILLILAVVKLIFLSGLLGVVFRDDIRSMTTKRAPQVSPTCMYCESKWTFAVDEGQTRWEGDELVLVTTYQCQHCHMPFWHLERVPVGSLKG